MERQRLIMSGPQTAARVTIWKERRSSRVHLATDLKQPVALRPAAGLSIAVLEVLAGLEGAKRKTYWWSKFWATIDARGGHWRARREFLRLGDRLVRVRDVAFVWAQSELEPGETTTPTCGHSDCVKHLRVVAAHQLAA